jgi:porphobilinogen deaminase
VLLNGLLEGLVKDFDHWFGRGLQLLERCPEQAMAVDKQLQLRQDLQEALAQLQVLRSLRGACSDPLGVESAAMGSWHQLVLRVWALAALMGRSSPPP